MKINIPKGKYIKKIEVNDASIDVEFNERKRIALLFISLNPNYWPYAAQVIQDCKNNFLPQHSVDYFMWTDAPVHDEERKKQILGALPSKADVEAQIAAGNGIQVFPRETIEETLGILKSFTDVRFIETGAIEWPHPTLMRYHLFLNEEDALKDYDYVFYLDADMRVVQKIGDDILGEDLTVALHPMYDLNPTFIPPYEPNSKSTAFIPRLGKLEKTDNGVRFRPLYLAGGLQGGRAKPFIKAMKEMKKNIDIDFNNNYTAIWNDESHWNKYIFEHRGPILDDSVIVLGPEYVHPDSLIKEYYEPRWGRKLEPKIYTITKPFSLSKKAGGELQKLVHGAESSVFTCETCGDTFSVPDHRVVRVVSCPGSGKQHQLEMKKI